MPRGDGTGPMGVGPTGWGRGGCVGPRGGFGPGFGPGRGPRGGFGLGFGSGRGMRGGRWLAAPYAQAAPDARLLEEQAEMLERQAAACRTMAREAKATDRKED